MFKIGEKVRCTTHDLEYIKGAPRMGEEFIVVSTNKDHIGMALPGLNSLDWNADCREGIRPLWAVGYFSKAFKTPICYICNKHMIEEYSTYKNVIFMYSCTKCFVTKESARILE